MRPEGGCGFSWMGVEGELNEEHSWLTLFSLTVKCSPRSDTEDSGNKGP